MIDDIFIIYADMSSTPRENMDAKLYYVWALQEFHRNSDFDTARQISALFLEKPKRRANAAFENKISLLDLADIPANTPNEKIIKLIASEMSKNKETKMKLSEWKTYRNEFLMFDGDSDELLWLSNTAIDHFNSLLNQEITKYQQTTGQKIPKKFFEIHNTTDQWTISLKSTEEIIWFIRKNSIINHPELPPQESVLYKIIVCAVLKKMITKQDYIENKEVIDGYRKVFDKFVTTELTKTFYHMPLDKNVDLIEDKSHANYFSDKLYRLPRKQMRVFGITYDHDIHFRITKRAKSENSIINKTIFDPELNSADAAKDIWGIRFLNQDENPEREKEEANILWYYMTKLYNKNNFASNDDLNDAYPQWENPQEIGKEYTKEDISGIIKFMYMELKDKDILKIKTVREKSETFPAVYELDKDFFACYWCTDKYVLAQMDAVVQKKNQDTKKAFDLSKKTKSEAKLDLFAELVKDEYPLYEDCLDNEKDLQILYWCEKKIGDINKKFATLKKIFDLDREIKNDREIYRNSSQTDEVTPNEVAPKKVAPKQKSISWDGQTYSYVDKWGATRNITVEPSKIDLLNVEAYYKHDDIKWFYVEIAHHKIYLHDIQSLHNDFIERWKDSPQNYENKDKWARKWSGSSARIDGKAQGRIHTSSWDYFLWEHQFMPYSGIKNIKPMTVSEIYQYVKQIFVTLRLEQLITVHDIVTMIQQCLIPTIKTKWAVENTMTWEQLLDAIIKDDNALPVWWTIEEKFLYELEHDRELKPLIINGKNIPGVFIYPKFEKRRKRNKLWFDNMERPQQQ